MTKQVFSNLLSKDFCFEQKFEVRDSEIDMFGVVNNSIYLTYLQHTRHSFFKKISIDFASLGAKGWNPVVTRIDVRYKKPLKSGDRFVVKFAVANIKRVKFQFIQKIFLIAPSSEEESTEMLEAFVEGTTISPEGRPALPEEFAILKKYLPQL